MVVVGRFGRTHGLRGFVFLHSFTEPKENILDLTPWYIEKNKAKQKITLETSHIHGKNIIVKLADCNDCNQASTYTNHLIHIERKQLPETKDNEYYWSDLEGLKVINKENDELGRVECVLATGANDVLVVKNDQLKPQQHFIPYIKDVIIKVDLENHLILVDWDRL